jgi:phosphatidylserine decarboxylase
MPTPCVPRPAVCLCASHPAADRTQARRYEGGSLCILRLAPQDYHRMHAPCAGRVGTPCPVGKEFYTVRRAVPLLSVVC